MHMAHSKVSILFLLVLMLSSRELITQALEGIEAEPLSTITIPLTVVHTMNQLYFVDKVGMQMKSRKLLEDGLVQLDYNYAGANRRHDPRRGRGGGRNL